MYNFFTHKKELRMGRQLRRLKEDFKEEECNRKQLNCELSESHRRRIEGFVMSMIDKPVHVEEFRNRQYRPRPENNSKSVGGSTFYFNGFRREIERINSEVQRNKVLDEVPYICSALHKFRDNSSATLPMHYKPQTTLERLETQLQQRRHNELENMPLSESVHKRDKENSAEKIQPVKKVTSRNLLPALHQKTHFKSLITIYNDYPQGSLNGKNKLNRRSNHQEVEVSEQQQLGNMDSPRQQNRRSPKKPGPTENFNPRETSKEALARCNLLPQSPQSASRLKCGGGLTVHSDTLTYKKLYKTLYDGRVQLNLMR